MGVVTGSGSWTLVGPEACKGNPKWPCPAKDCAACLAAKTRKNSGSQYAVCETRRSDDPSTCQFYNLNKSIGELEKTLASVTGARVIMAGLLPSMYFQAGGGEGILISMTIYS